MDDAKEGFRLIDIVIGIICLCALAVIVVILYRSYMMRGTQYVSSIESESSEAPLIRLSELSMSSDPVLCTAAASVLQDLETVEISYILIVTDAGSTIYTYANASISNPNGATIVYSEAPTDEAVQTLLSQSDSRCSVDYQVDNSNRYSVTVVVQ